MRSMELRVTRSIIGAVRSQLMRLSLTLTTSYSQTVCLRVSFEPNYGVKVGIIDLTSDVDPNASEPKTLITSQLSKVISQNCKNNSTKVIMDIQSQSERDPANESENSMLSYMTSKRSQASTHSTASKNPQKYV